MTTKREFIKIGKMTRKGKEGNLVVGSFAASLIDEGYPLDKPMWDILFKNMDDEVLGRRFVEWMKSDD